MKQMLAILAAAAAFCAMAEKQPFERYQTIIDRMPFGQPPLGFDPTRDPSEVSKDEYSKNETELTQEQEAIQKAVKFSVINVENDGTVRVGFTDMTDQKAPRHYYLAVGETRGGWSVKAADASEKKMTVEKDGVEVELSLGEDSAGIDGKAVAAARGATRPQRSALLNRGGDSAAPMSLRGRRERREAEEAARRAEDAKLAAERERERLEREKREAEERAVREAERAEQREQLNALKEELMRQREEAKAARERDEDSEDEEEPEDGE